jgi:putative nucleotidyltransferase with HDIG domain
VSTLTYTESTDLPLALIALPPFPAVALKALRVMSRQDSRLRELHDLIRADQAFSSEILRIVNSPLFPFPTAITNTMQAVMLLGFERVQSLAVAIGVRAYVKDSLEFPVLRSCWRHSLASAIIAEHLSGAALLDKDAAYTAGVLHDIGRLALAVGHRRQYAAFLKASEAQPCDVLARERELFGVDHCQAGRSLVSAWNLPQYLAEIAAHHHQPTNPEKFDLLFVIRLACSLADRIGYCVVSSLNPLTYEQLRAELPLHNRHLLPADPAELAARIEAEMILMETA